MMQIKKLCSEFAEMKFSKADADEIFFHRRWHNLCEKYLPITLENSIWRLNRERQSQEPLQGWKLHISATVPEACHVFERVVPFLISQDVQFKAPKSLDELTKINSGLHYGYFQVGKFITVYPPTERSAVEIARYLHELTEDFFAVSVPFDEQYLPKSSVFYRYGAFSLLEATDEKGNKYLAIQDSAGEFIPDNRFQSFPPNISNPFQTDKESFKSSFSDTPLGATYRIFSAITQRGKGGTYQALDFSTEIPRLCIVKEGRRGGELTWGGQDGYALVKNEFEVLSILRKKCDAVPQVIASFEVDDNFYFVMEYVRGKSLNEILKNRRRRFSIKQTLKIALEITKIIEKIHQAGWIWNDCKPANLIITKDKSLRPLDFEGAYRINQSEPFNWKTKGFSKFGKRSAKSNEKSNDLYALGAVIYFILTGKFYDLENPVKIRDLRRNVPQELVKVIEELLSDNYSDIFEVGKDFEKLVNLI